jgi:hypothetical protein
MRAGIMILIVPAAFAAAAGRLEAQVPLGTNQAAQEDDGAEPTSWKSLLRSALESRINITHTDNARLRITEAGTVLLVQHEGITASPAQDASMLLTKVDGGKIKQAGGLSALLADKKTNLDYLVGERLYCIAIKVKDDAVQLWLLTTQIAPVTIKGSTQQTRYKAALEFKFSKDFLATASADSVLARMADVLTIERAAAGPATVALGQTATELEAALGKPEKIIDLGTKKIYVYKDIKVTLVDGKVADVQ